MRIAHVFFHEFGWSLAISVGGLIAALTVLGWNAMLAVLVLILIEITFSFDNAIVNAKILGGLSRIWQKLFLSLGLIIAVLGMRIVFPILIVSLTAHLGWSKTITLALNQPAQYAAALKDAHTAIAAFGGAFLLLLALHFFLDDEREHTWLERIERSLQRMPSQWFPGAATLLAVVVMAILPANHEKFATFAAGLSGMVTFGVTRLAMLSMRIVRKKEMHTTAKQTGIAALITFLYLELLDASFSFDSVIGAFAITDKVILIALGLGIGALWVRSLTVLIVRHGTLNEYIYLEHGAHYAILVLALALLLSIVVNTPDPNTPAGIIGVLLIAASFRASRKHALHTSHS